MAKTIVVLGARDLGGAIVDHFGERGWNVAAVARSDDTLEQVGGGARALRAERGGPGHPGHDPRAGGHAGRRSLGAMTS